MNKWKTSLLLTLLLSNSAWGHYKPFTGFYAGLDVGLVQTVDHDDYDTLLQWPQAFEIAILSNLKLTDTSALGGVRLGYSALLQNRWVLGLEGRAHFQDLYTVNNEKIREVNSMLHIERHSSVSLDQDFSVIAKLGFTSHCKFLMYGLVGIDWGKLSLFTNTVYEQNLGVMISGELENKSSNYEDGLLLGFGMEYYITKCSTIGLEYNYIDYGSLNFKNPTSGNLIIDNVAQVGSFIIDNNAIKMQSNRVFLKFNYYFA